MITDNISSFVYLFSKCWREGQIPDCSDLDGADIFNVRRTLFEKIGFGGFGKGDDLLRHVFSDLVSDCSLKNTELAVIVLDSIYHTRLENPIQTARALYDLNTHTKIISLITQSEAQDRRKIVDTIATINKIDSINAKNIYSFATKFCNFVSPTKYPIYDRYSATLIYKYLQIKKADVCGERVCYYKMGNYSYYISAYDKFIEEYDLDRFSYKEIDEYLWSYGKLLEASEYFKDRELTFNSVEYIPIKKTNKISVLIEGHLYAGEELCDKFLLPKYLGKGINPTFVLKPLTKNMGKSLTIEYYNDTTIGTIQETLCTLIWGKHWDSMCGPMIVFFFEDDLRMEVDNKDSNFAYLLSKYLDKNGSGKIKAAFYISEDAGHVWIEENLRFDFHSKELTKHNEPHIHVEDRNHNRNASISLNDGSVLDGKLLSKDLKRARKIIVDHQKEFLDDWNRKTDGLAVDVNHKLGLIKY